MRAKNDNDKLKQHVRLWRNKCLLAVLVIFLLAGSMGVEYYLETSVTQLERKEEKQQDKEYVFYVGLNDKDTNQQEIETEWAKKKLQELLLKYSKGYTLYEAEGGWLGDNGTLFTETTLVCTVKNVDEENIKPIMDEMLKEFNQECILFEENYLWETYYYGGEALHDKDGE